MGIWSTGNKKDLFTVITNHQLDLPAMELSHSLFMFRLARYPTFVGPLHLHFLSHIGVYSTAKRGFMVASPNVAIDKY